MYLSEDIIHWAVGMLTVKPLLITLRNSKLSIISYCTNTYNSLVDEKIMVWHVFFPAPIPAEDSIHEQWLDLVHRTTFFYPLIGTSKHVWKFYHCSICMSMDHGTEQCPIMELEAYHKFCSFNSVFRESGRDWVSEAWKGNLGGREGIWGSTKIYKKMYELLKKDISFYLLEN